MKDSKFQTGDMVGIKAAPSMKAHIISITADECSEGIQYQYVARLYVKTRFGDKEWSLALGPQYGAIRFNEIELKLLEEEQK